MNISTTTYILKERHHTNYLNLKISTEKRQKCSNISDWKKLNEEKGSTNGRVDF